MCVMLPEVGVVLDAGTAFFRVREKLQTSQLHVLLSHAHLDHVVGLSFLFDVLGESETKAHVYAQADKLSVVRQHLFHPMLFPVTPPYQDHALDGESSPPAINASLSRPTAGEFTLSGSVRVQWFCLQHPGEAIGFRLTFADGRSLAYVTDTVASPQASYLEHIQGVDLLIHECYFDDGLEDRAELTGHSCLTPVLQVARAAGVRRVALIHLSPIPGAAPALDRIAALAHSLDVFVPTDRQIVTL